MSNTVKQWGSNLLKFIFWAKSISIVCDLNLVSVELKEWPTWRHSQYSGTVQISSHLSSSVYKDISSHQSLLITNFFFRSSYSRASIGQNITNPRAKALWDKWRHVWMMAWERDQKLRDKLGYLQELENVKHFNWNEWRQRFLKYHNNRKSRVTDFFRKLDDDADGYLTRLNLCSDLSRPLLCLNQSCLSWCFRDEFIDGIMGSKFPSSRLELNAVADRFDNGEGLIDWHQFIAALRPDWEDRIPLSDYQQIEDEIERQVALCTCRQKFKVFQVAEGKYRVGRKLVFLHEMHELP